MTVLNLTKIRTEPGLGDDHPFSPTAGFDGSSEDYLAFMRRRYKTEYHPHGQRMVAAAVCSVHLPMDFTGPFAEEAKRLVDSLRPKRTTAAA